MARVVLAALALTACLALFCQTPAVQARVIVRRQAEFEQDLTTVANDEQFQQTTVAEEEDVATTTAVPISKVATTTPPRPNDRFEQFPSDGLASSDGASVSASSGASDADEDITGSLSETVEQSASDSDGGDEERLAPTTTLAPSVEERVGSSSSDSMTAEEEEESLDSASLSRDSSVTSGSFGSQQSESHDVSNVEEDSTVAPTESIVANEITTPVPTVAPVRADESESVAASESVSSSASESLEPSVESVVASSQSSASEAETNEVPQGASADLTDRRSTQEQQDSTAERTAEEEQQEEEEEEITTEEVRVEPSGESAPSVAPTAKSEVETERPDIAVKEDAAATAEVERFDLSRLTAPSNASAERPSLESLDILAEGKSSTEEAEESNTTVPTTLIVGEQEDGNRTTNVESGSSQVLERTPEVELVSNEVGRNQTQPMRTKKGKFLDVVNEETTEDNDINGAAWALAGMRMVERKQSTDASPAAGESTEGGTLREDSGVVASSNNTLKQLMDWAIIMQQADFANSSFVRSTVASDEVPMANGKDRRTYANKVPTVEGVDVDVLSEENRLTAAVTEEAPRAEEPAGTETEEANVLDTTFVPSTEGSARPAAPSDGAQELEDFGFEDRSSSSTTMANEVIGGSGVLPTTTRRTYEVSENVDEDAESVRIRNTPMIRTTTQRSDASGSSGMSFEDVPVTTYSPSAPILRRTEPTLPPIPLTTMITRLTTTSVPFRRPTTTVQDMAASFTTTDMPMKETTTMGAPSEPPSSEQTLLVRESTGPKPLDQDNSSDLSEVTLNLLNRTEDDAATMVSTMPSLTTTMPGPSTATLTNNVELDDSASVGELGTSVVSTERADLAVTTTSTTMSPSSTSEEPADEEGGKVPIVVDDRHAYDTVTTTTVVMTTTSGTMLTPTTTVAAGGQSGMSSEMYTTRRTIDRSMTTTELSEEESVTEEDYIELNGAQGAGGQAGKTGDVAEPTQVDGTTEQSQGEPAAEEDNSVVVAVVASIVSVIVVLLLIAAFIVFRKRQNQVSYGQRCRPVGLDAYSLDNVSVYNSVRRKGNTARMSKRSYGNSAFEDPNFKTNPLSVAELANIIQNKTAIYDEFKEIPNVTARADEVPEGCEDKNRYANVVPLPETRVHLKRLNEDEKTEYINANFVKGPKDSANYYIACQAPMENTINDFWRMIWEQNSKVIIMATDLSENGVEKCAEYLPPSVVLDNSRTFGDFQLTLKNRENKEKYTISTVHMRHAPSNNLREVMHFWYQWPDTGVPIDESSIIGMLLEARTHLKLSPSELAEFAAIAEEEAETEGQVTAAANGTEGSANNNNNNNNNNATSNGTAGKEASAAPASIVSNGGTNTMDKHKSLQRTQGPLTVHCSPGTGRTGTLVACDIALRLLEVPPRTVDVPQIVYYVRRGRASAVRTREQYELIYRVANVYATKLTGPTIET